MSKYGVFLVRIWILFTVLRWPYYRHLMTKFLTCISFKRFALTLSPVKIFTSITPMIRFFGIWTLFTVLRWPYYRHLMTKFLTCISFKRFALTLSPVKIFTSITPMIKFFDKSWAFLDENPCKHDTFSKLMWY